MEINANIIQFLDYLLESEYVKQVHKHLPIMDVVNYDYVRVGRDSDGGYVMVNDFKNIKNAYSCGINDDISWDLDFVDKAARGGVLLIFSCMIILLTSCRKSVKTFIFLRPE